MTSIDASTVATHSFDWGVIKWFVSPDQTPGAQITFGEVPHDVAAIHEAALAHVQQHAHLLI